MREQKELFKREQRDDRIDVFEENTNIMTGIDDTGEHVINSLSELQPTVYEDKMLIKQSGVLKELVVEDTKIILKEIE